MTNFEDQLKLAMQRKEPSADFTARVLARCAAETAEEKASPWRALFSGWRLSFATALAALLVAGAGVAYQRHEHEARGLAAKRQLLLAMRIAGSKIHQVQETVLESE